MATWTNFEGNQTFTFDDDKLNFDDWIAQTEEKLTAWLTSTVDYGTWKAANPGKAPNEYNGQSSVIFNEWTTYANATLVS